MNDMDWTSRLSTGTEVEGTVKIEVKYFKTMHERDFFDKGIIKSGHFQRNTHELFQHND